MCSLFNACVLYLTRVFCVVSYSSAARPAGGEQLPRAGHARQAPAPGAAAADGEERARGRHHPAGAARHLRQGRHAHLLPHHVGALDAAGRSQVIHLHSYNLYTEGRKCFI